MIGRDAESQRVCEMRRTQPPAVRQSPNPSAAAPEVQSEDYLQAYPVRQVNLTFQFPLPRLLTKRSIAVRGKDS
ncbi:MAG: hypothetical protein QOJ99_5556 [Bryobacterales bacterium]|jgi:hypothetical protein|nr:hypothetical protein [Bryobacterales bacterium]MEA2475744.1 hypothetical protein [Thermoleophilaceae bacterium]